MDVIKGFIFELNLSIFSIFLFNSSPISNLSASEIMTLHFSLFQLFFMNVLWKDLWNKI